MGWTEETNSSEHMIGKIALIKIKKQGYYPLNYAWTQLRFSRSAFSGIFNSMSPSKMTVGLWFLRTCFRISSITSLMIASGLFELWSPSNIFKCFSTQGQFAYSFSEFLLFIRASRFPDMNMTVVSGRRFRTDYLTSNSSMSYWARLSTSFLSFEKTQGKKQFIMKLGTTAGECSLATCLHRLLKDLNDESATMNYAWP